MMLPSRPSSPRKTVQFMVALTILAWATQTLLHQWGYGQVVAPQAGDSRSIAPQAIPSATLELRDRVQISGDVLTLRNICRWSDRDANTFDPLADQVLLRLNGADGVRKITSSDIRSALQSAGANLATIQISGAAACAVVKGHVDEDQVSRAMSEGGQSATAEAAAPSITPGASIAPASSIAPAPATQPIADSARSSQSRPVAQASESPAEPAPAAAPSAAAQVPETAAPQISLKALLIQDLCNRLALSDKQLQIQFEPRDTPTLALTAPRITFQIDSSQAQRLGNVAWAVTIKSDQGDRIANIDAHARAWEDQIVLTRSLSPGQSIHANDVAPRRALVEQIHREKVVEAGDAVGEAATRALERGEILTADMISAPRIVQRGDFITVSLQIGQTRVETVARAMSAGAKGDSIRATNEATGQIYSVVVTAPGSGTVTAIEGSDQDIARINPQVN